MASCEMIYLKIFIFQTYILYIHIFENFKKSEFERIIIIKVKYVEEHIMFGVP